MEEALNPVQPMTARRLLLMPKPELSDAQNRLINARLAAPEHAHDEGPPRVWNTYQASTLYAFFREEDGALVGLVEASGPSRAISPGWWIDSKYRGCGYWRELIDLLAEHLKSKGVTGVGRIPITTYQGAHDDASIAMAKHFKAHFPDQ